MIEKWPVWAATNGLLRQNHSPAFILRELIKTLIQFENMAIGQK